MPGSDQGDKTIRETPERPQTESPAKKLGLVAWVKKKASSWRIVGLSAFFADLYVTCWIWSDLVGCHDRARLILLWFALGVAHGVLCYFAFKVLNQRWKWPAIIWLALSVFSAFAAYENLPEPKPTPRLSLLVSDGKRDLPLTNEDLFITTTFFSSNITEYLRVPITPGNRGAELKLAICNEVPDTEAKSIELCFFVEKGLRIGQPRPINSECWHEYTPPDVGDWDGFSIFMPTLPSSDNVTLMPPLYFEGIDTNRPYFARLNMKALGSPKKELAFWMFFSETTNTLPKLFHLISTRPGSGSNTIIIKFDRPFD